MRIFYDLIRHQNKQLPNHGAHLESCDAGLVLMKLCIDSQESREVKRSIRHEKIRSEKYSIHIHSYSCSVLIRYGKKD